MFGTWIFATLLLSGVEAWTVGQVVNTTSGRFRGSQAPGTNGVSQYLGIPYGLSTDGDRRFAPPVRKGYTSSVYNADKTVSCPANSFLGPGGIRALPFANRVNFGINGANVYDVITNAVSDPNSEDCLQLSIWTKPQTGEAAKAVLLYVYGGAFAYGSIGDPRYNGKHLADTRDVIVVAINFRSNIFGFSGAPNGRQNVGYLDVRMGTEWVRDNIAAFGGDPKRITMYGESSGGAALDYYALAYAQDPIVHAFIPQSGSIYGLPPDSQGSLGPKWSTTAWKLGCFPLFGDAYVLKCMRSKSFQDILQAISGQLGYASLAASLDFGPVVDGQTIFSDWLQRFQSGRFAKVPRLTGTTDNEVEVIQPAATALNGIPLPQPLVDVLSAQVFQCPCANYIKDIVRNGVRAYRYRWFGYYPNTAFGVGVTATKAYHASEITMVFGTSNDSGIANTPEQTPIESYMMTVWTTFAKNPNNGLANLGWPIYSNSNPQIVRLGYQNKTGFSTVGASTYDNGCLPTFSVPSLDDIVKQIMGGRFFKR